MLLAQFDKVMDDPAIEHNYLPDSPWFQQYLLDIRPQCLYLRNEQSTSLDSLDQNPSQNNFVKSQ